MNITSPIIMDADEPLSKAVYRIRDSKAGVIVVSGKEYLGIIDERQLGSLPKDTSKAKCGKYAIKTPVIRPPDSLPDVVKAFFAGRFKTLPVIEGSRIVGTISRWDVLSELARSNMVSGMKVSQYMTSPVVTIDSSENVARAKSVMRTKNIRRLVVTTNGKISGILSFFDLSRLAFAKSIHAPQMRKAVGEEKTPLSSFMRQSIETIGQNASLNDAISKMLSSKVAALVVNDGLRPVGILTTKDILEAIMRSEHEAKVSISGIHGFEEDAQGAYEFCMESVEKLSKSAKIDALNLHVKKTGSQYFVSAHVHGTSPLLASASGWSLEEAVRGAIHELRTQAGKIKTRRISEKKGRERE